MADFRYVLPGSLRVSPMRPDGADAMKLQDQFNEYGFSAVDMPAIEVTLGGGGEMMVNNGMTRAMRCYMIDPEQAVKIEIIDYKPEWDFSQLLTVSETVTPDF